MKRQRPEFARDLVVLFGGAFVGFETNLAVRQAEGTFLDQQPALIALGGLGVTAGMAYWLSRRDDKALARPTWVGRGTPYPGLLPFGEQRAGVFFGRDQEINELAGRLSDTGKSASSRFLLLVGASGSGKSSLLQAGLKPRLTQTGDWTVLGPVTPGGDPVAMLSMVDSSIRDEAGHGRVRGTGSARRLLLIDQTEEILTLAPADVRIRFIQQLIRLLDEDPGLKVVAALRSEFLTQLLNSQAAPLLRDPYILAPLTEEGLKATITGPARSAGITFEDGVVDRMLREATGGDALPLLAYLLRELCPGDPDGHRVTVAAYRMAGGVEGALRRQADSVLRNLEGRHSVQDVIVTLLRFVTLVGPEPARRSVATAELSASQREIVAEFVDARLLVTTDSAVDLAHEALLRQWEPLRLAISARAEALRRRSNLEPYAREWDRAGRRDDFLLVGKRLREVREWLSDPAIDTTRVVEEFVEASVRQAVATARENADLVAGQALRLLPTYPELAGALARAAVAECSPTPQALYALRRTLDAPLRRIRRLDSQIRALRWSTSGRLAAVCSDGTIRVWPDETGDPVVLATPGGQALDTAWAPDGRLAAGFQDGGITVWAPDLRQSRHLTAHATGVRAMAWSDPGGLASLSEAGELRVKDQALVPQSERTFEPVHGHSLAWSSKGSLAVGFANGRIHLVDEHGETSVISTHGGRVLSLAWSPDGALAVGSTDGIVRVFDAQGVLISRPSGHGGRVLTVAWSPDGRLASASDNGEIHVSTRDGSEKSVVSGHQGPVRALVWSAPDRLLSGGDDGTVMDWAIEADTRSEVRHTGVEERTLSVAWSPTGELAAAAHDKVRIWSSDGLTVTDLEANSEVWSVAWSTAGRLAASTTDGYIRTWERGSAESVRWRGHRAGVWSAAWSANGQLATGANDGSVRVWSSPDATPFTFTLGEVEVWSVGWSSDGHLAAGAENGVVWIWRPGTDEETRLPAGSSPVWVVDWSTDGRLAAASGDGIVRVWRPEDDGEALLLEGHGNGAWSVAWSADGRLAVGSGDGVVRVWRPGSPTGPVELSLHDDGVWWVAWSPDGRLASCSEDGAVRVTDIPNDDAADLLERFAGRGFRDLTAGERRRHRLQRQEG